MENILKCENCGEWLISEESANHICHSRFDTMLFDSDGTFSFDGKNWYRWIPDDFLQGDKNNDNRRGLDRTLVVVRLKYH
ncbi:MAG: hypothetical protein M3530_10760 [Thermoproteota archaeon]|nr:hypothetical protein [Thermoproteota archaeon]